MRLKGDLAVAAFFLLLGLYGLIQSLMFGPQEAVLLPAAVSGIIVVLAGIELVRLLRGERVLSTAAKPELHRQVISREERRRLALIIGWTLALVVGVYLLGFRIVIPLFAFSYLKWRGWGWVTAVVFAAAMAGFAYGVFEIGLNAQLFKGIIFGGR